MEKFKNSEKLLLILTESHVDLTWMKPKVDAIRVCSKAPMGSVKEIHIYFKA